MTEEQIERLAVEHEAFGFGRVDDAGFSTHGFDPSGLAAFAKALIAAERERWIAIAKSHMDMAVAKGAKEKARTAASILEEGREA